MIYFRYRRRGQPKRIVVQRIVIEPAGEFISIGNTVGQDSLLRGENRKRKNEKKIKRKCIPKILVK